MVKFLNPLKNFIQTLSHGSEGLLVYLNYREIYPCFLLIYCSFLFFNQVSDSQFILMCGDESNCILFIFQMAIQLSQYYLLKSLYLSNSKFPFAFVLLDCLTYFIGLPIYSYSSTIDLITVSVQSELTSDWASPLSSTPFPPHLFSFPCFPGYS